MCPGGSRSDDSETNRKNGLPREGSFDRVLPATAYHPDTTLPGGTVQSDWGTASIHHFSCNPRKRKAITARTLKGFITFASSSLYGHQCHSVTERPQETQCAVARDVAYPYAMESDCVVVIAELYVCTTTSCKSIEPGRTARGRNMQVSDQCLQRNGRLKDNKPKHLLIRERQQARGTKCFLSRPDYQPRVGRRRISGGRGSNRLLAHSRRVDACR